MENQLSTISHKCQNQAILCKVFTLDPPTHHDHKSDQNIEFVCLPTEVDGKVKFVWSKTTTSMQNCYVCGAKVWLTLDTFVIFPMSPTC